jgi:hypothetical protein
MAKHDFSKCSPEALNAFFTQYESVSITQYGWKEFQVLKEQARVKTRAEYDREIGRIVRGERNEEMPFGITYWEWTYFIDLVIASKNAPEE